MGKWLDMAKAFDMTKAQTNAAARQAEPLDAKREAKKAQELVARQGWCAVKSEALGGEVVIWAKNTTVTIPSQWRGAVVYTLKELAALATPPKPTPDQLRLIHEAKRIFSGTVEAAKD
ncbi:MAG: hypothetical protein DDT19_01919 [Syntrophomonadaceae bacterium]|nr:hypothetical protein [Bacillota bacterium]